MTPTHTTTSDFTPQAALSPLSDPDVAAVSSATATDLERLSEQVSQLQTQLDQLRTHQPSDRVTLLVFSGDMDKLMSAFIIAAGAAAMGSQVSLFFTFWGLAAIKKSTVYQKKSWLEKMFAFMLPSSPKKTGLSKMNMLGLGPVFLKTIMKRHRVEPLEQLVDLARQMDVRIIACQMSMGILGISREELIDDIELGGVGTYLGQATDSRVSLFI